MGITDYGSPGQYTNFPSLSAWAQSVSNVLDNSDTSINTRLLAAVPKSLVGNLLSANQASAETDTTGFFSFNGPTLSAVASSPAHGSKVLRAVLTAAVTEIYVLGGSGSNNLYRPVVAGQAYTFEFDVRQTAGTRTSSAVVAFFDASFTVIGSPISSTASPGASFVRQSVTATAPAGAAYIFMKPWISAGSAGDTVEFDRFGFWAGAGGDWAMPGVPIINLGRKVSHPNTDDVLVQTWDSALNRWQTAHYDSGWRDVAGLLNSTDWALSDSLGYCRMRATYGEVEVIGRLKRVTAGANRNLRTVMLTLPTGFGGPKGYVPTGVFWVSDTLPLGMISDLGAENRLDANIPGASSGTWATGDQCAFRAKFARVSTIPTSLPGTLVSSAPA